jgi:hypothetical protein
MRNLGQTLTALTPVENIQAVAAVDRSTSNNTAIKASETSLFLEIAERGYQDHVPWPSHPS